MPPAITARQYLSCHKEAVCVCKHHMITDEWLQHKALARGAEKKEVTVLANDKDHVVMDDT